MNARMMLCCLGFGAFSSVQSQVALAQVMPDSLKSLAKFQVMANYFQETGSLDGGEPLTIEQLSVEATIRGLQLYRIKRDLVTDTPGGPVIVGVSSSGVYMLGGFQAPDVSAFTLSTMDDHDCARITKALAIALDPNGAEKVVFQAVEQSGQGTNSQQLARDTLIMTADICFTKVAVVSSRESFAGGYDFITYSFLLRPGHPPIWSRTMLLHNSISVAK